MRHPRPRVHPAASSFGGFRTPAAGVCSTTLEGIRKPQGILTGSTHLEFPSCIQMSLRLPCPFLFLAACIELSAASTLDRTEGIVGKFLLAARWRDHHWLALCSVRPGILSRSPARSRVRSFDHAEPHLQWFCPVVTGVSGFLSQTVALAEQSLGRVSPTRALAPTSE
jgi:hypothetical protein